MEFINLYAVSSLFLVNTQGKLLLASVSLDSKARYWGECERAPPVELNVPPVYIYIYVRTFWSPGGPVLRANVKPA